MIRRCVLLLLFSVSIGSLPVLAQSPSLALSDINFSNHCYHLVAKVELGSPDSKIQSSYQYDRYQRDVGSNYAGVRIRLDKKEYAKKSGGSWKESSDWGDTGTAVDSQLADQLDSFAQIVEMTFAKRTSHDPSQGGFVWKAINTEAQTKYTLYQMELSREHPRPEGVYPRYTFIKYPDDVDGKLLLVEVESNIRSDTLGLFPVVIHFDYCFPLPAGTKVTFPTHPGVKVTDTAGYELNLVAYKETGMPLPDPDKK